MSITFEGVAFKNPPAADMAAYPYMTMYASSSAEYKYRIILSQNKYYYQTSDGNLATTGSVKNYWMTEAMAQNGSDWELRDTTMYSIGNASTRTLVANYNVPIGSSSGTEYFMKHNMDIPTMLNQFQASSNSATSCTLSMSGCEVGNLLVAAYAVRGSDNVVTLSDGWEVLGGGNAVLDTSNNYQRIFFASKTAQSESEELVVKQTKTGRIYVVVAEFYGISSAEMCSTVANVGTSNYTVESQKPSESSMMFYAVSSVSYGSSGGRAQTVSPTDLLKVRGDSSAERLAGWFDNGDGAMTHTFRAYTNSGAYEANVEAVELLANKTSYHTTGHADYIVAGADRVHSSADSYIEWTFESPEGTACDVLVKVGDGDFLKAENGGQIPGLDNGTDMSITPIAVRVALFTENAEVTPVFHSLSLWIADEDDRNVISLHFPPGNQNGVQNAAAPITVAYNGATLSGDGGFVQAFELECPIDGLTYKGDQNDAEHIEIASIQTVGTLTRIYYSGYTAPAEHIEIGNITATGVLTHVDDI